MTDNLTINVEGIDKLFAKLGKLEGVNHLRAPMDAALTVLETYMEYYPPALGGIQGTAVSPVRFTTKGGKSVSFMAASYRGYKRTGKLGQRWANGKRVSTSANGIEGKLTNNLKYAPYVQSAALQAKVHQGRWRTDEMAVNKHRGWIVQAFNDAIAEALR